MQHVQCFRSEGTSLTFDSRHYPVIIATWRGRMTSEAVRTGLSWTAQVARRAQDDDRRFVLISDTTRLEARPHSELLKMLAAGIDGMNERQPGRFIRLLIIVRSNAMRAAFAMMLWLLQRKFRISTMRSVPSAIQRAKALLEASGVALPPDLDPDAYVPPFDDASVLDVSGL